MSFRIQMLLDTSRFQDAEAMIRRELAGDLENPDLYLLLARALTEQRKFQAARDAVSEAISLEPNDPIAHYIQASICREQGRVKEGLAAVERAIAIDAEDVDNYSLKAGLLLDTSKWQKALDATEMGLALDADDESCLFYRGLALAKLGREDEAEGDSLHLLGLDADAAANHVSRGWVLLEAGKAADATRHFSEALRIDSTREDAKAGLSEAVILARPIAGRVLTLIEKLDRVNMWVLLVAVLVLSRVKRALEKDADWAWAGNLIDVFYWGVAMLILTAPLLFERLLKTDKLTQHALSERRSKGLRFATPFLIAGGLLFAMWVWSGTKSAPYLTLAILSLAVMIREMFESENRWVRNKMQWVAVVFGLVVVGSFYSQFFIIPTMVEGVMDGATDYVKGESSESKTQLLSGMERALTLRKQTVIFPSLGLMLLAFFRDALSSWLQQRAPDGEWE